MEIKINIMKKRLSIYTIIITLLIAGTVFAQEATVEEQSLSSSEPQEIIEEIIPNEIIPEESVDSEEDISSQEQNQNIKTSIEFEEIFEVQTVSSFEEDLEQVSTTTSTTTESSTTTPQINIFIRNGVDIIFDNAIEFEDEGTVAITDIGSVEHQVSLTSVLGQLVKLDQVDDAFEISKIQYYESFGSLYLKCITIDAIEYCDNWQYLVNGFSPWSGIDQTTVSADDAIVLYFGTPYQVVFSTDIFTVDAPFIARAEQYDYQTNTWSGRTNVTLGVTIPDPENPWTPIELHTALVNSNGEATFAIATSGDYMIGVQDDWYYPLYSITVSTSSATSTDSATSTTGGGSGGGSSNSREFNIASAISFIKSLQGANGSYGSSELYSDWVAIAFGSASTNDSRLMSYLKARSQKDIVTETERRIMAILAMGDNPYDFAGKNYVQAVIDSFDGTQIGERSLINDDIFGVLVLSKVGFDQGDVEIKKTIEFILSKQNSSGLWENSTDLTAAAIQALNPHSSVSGVSSAIAKAKNALKNSQQSDGGWGNMYTTAWVAQAMYELGENWTKNSKSVQDYFTNSQQSDGGVLSTADSNTNRIWATSYVIPAVLEKSWNDILQSVSKPALQSQGSGASNSIATSTSATSTPIIATTTRELITEEELVLDLAATSTISFETIVNEFEENISEEESVSTSTISTTTDIQEENVSRVNWVEKMVKTIKKPITSFFNFLMNLF